MIVRVLYKKYLRWIYFILALVLLPIDLHAQDILKLSNTRLNTVGEIELKEDWKGIAGDNFNWTNREFDFSGWEEVNTYLTNEDLTKLNWQGYGWFKKIIQVDSSLIGKPLLLKLNHHNGASQIFLDETLVLRVGDFSILKEDELMRSVPNHQIIQFSDTTRHVLSVRFSNHETPDFTKYGLSPGFSISLLSNAFFINNYESGYSNPSITKILVLLGLLTALAGVHFLFLIFYPQGEKNLYFVLFAGGITFLSLFLNFEHLSFSPSLVLDLQKGIYIGWLFALIGLLKFSYSILKNSTPIQLSIFLVVGLAIIVVKIGGWFEVSTFIAVFTILTFLEVLRVYLLVALKQRQHISILVWGLFIYLGFVLYSIPQFEYLINSPFALLDNLLGVSFLVFSISSYLLKDFAKAQIRLEYKFLEVKHLSERSIEQEKRSKVKEIEQQVLERENQRKTAELEEARALQISMLPAQIPNTEFWDIDAYMDPSQEVGGDYYDFSLSKNGELTVALGDATGHGMKAGIIVATAKSYFHSLVNEYDNISIIKNMSAGIKNLDIKMMYMGLMLLKCKGRSVKFTSAGMPPALIYRKKEHIVEQVLLKAMPLGSSVNFPYHELEYEVEAGDIFLLFSDGLMELFNPARDQLGMDNISQKLMDISDLKASEILMELKKLQTKWSGKAVQEDDVTILVMKAK